MIGTHHKDKNGAARLKRKLEEIAPETILLEGQGITEQTRIESVTHIQRELELEKIDERVKSLFLEQQKYVNYEWKIAESYASQRKITLVFQNDEIIYPSDLKAEAREIAQNLNKRKYMKLKHDLEERQKEINGGWEDLKRIINTPLEMIEANSIVNSSQRGLGPRDAIMEQTLRNYIQLNPEKKIVTINGYSHLLWDVHKRTLYSRIIDLNPQRIFLWD